MAASTPAPLSTAPAANGAERAEQIDYVSNNLLSRSALLVRLLVKQVRHREITRGEGAILCILSEGPRRVTDLAELEGVAQPTMTALIKRLAERGWVTREGTPEDGRVVMVALTDAGRAVEEDFRAQFLGALRADLEELSDEQLASRLAATETLGSFVDLLQQRVGR
jgi:DNA-binding MarR family transcriptional regulator